MNITKPNWLRMEIPEQELYARKNIWGKLDGPKLKITGGKTAKEALGCSVSISEESKELLKQSKEELKQKEEELNSENQSAAIDLKDLTNRSIGNTVRIFETNLQYLYGAMCHGTIYDTETTPVFDFGGFNSAYEKLRKETETQYAGEELEEELRLLKADYEQVLSGAKKQIEALVRFHAKQGPEAEKTVIRNIFGMEGSEILNMAGIGKDKSFADSIDAIVEFLLKNNGKNDEI